MVESSSTSTKPTPRLAKFLISGLCTLGLISQLERSKGKYRKRSKLTMGMKTISLFSWETRMGGVGLGSMKNLVLTTA